jgi:hypothetical protein
LSCHASLDADATPSDTIQKTPLTPTLAPKAPNMTGITTLDALIVMRRNPSASP